MQAREHLLIFREQTVALLVCQGGECGAGQSTGTLQHCSTAALQHSALSAPAAGDATAAAALAFHTALKDLVWTLAQDN